MSDSTPDTVTFSPPATFNLANHIDTSPEGLSNHHGAPKSSSISGPTLNARSCTTCRRRKVRCDKRHPCSNCTKAGIDCVFPGPGRAPRKARKPPDTELLARLRRLEGVVQSLGAQVDEEGKVESQPPQGAGKGKEKSGSDSLGYCEADPKKLVPKTVEKEFGRLVIDEGRSRYVSNAFWASLGDEVAEMRDILDIPSSEEEDNDFPSPEHSGTGNSGNSGSGSTNSATHQSFIFGFRSLSSSLRSLHPTPTQLFILWEVYKENVDPVVKILHRPTTKRLVMDASGGFEKISKSTEAHLFSVYYAAVTSLTAEQCMSLLGEEKDAVIDKYRFAVEQSLARAGFLNSQSLILLQAFVLFLICVRRQDDTRVVWMLSGIAVRLAQALGIHRDGTNFGLSPYETEMRRRLWWHICILDVRASEDHGADPSIFEQFYDTRLPLNINDDDISPELKGSPPERLGCTEQTFCLIRFEVSVTVKRLNYVPPGAGLCHDRASAKTLEDKERLIDACHKRLEERYLQYCDMSVPIYWVTATVARLIMAKMWLAVHHPLQREDRGRDLPQDLRDRLFLTSIEVIEFSRLLETNENTAKWGWLFRTYMQWHAVAFVLAELCVRPTCALTDRAWMAIEAVYTHWDMSPVGKKGMLWRPMRKLMAKAQKVRARQQQQDAHFPKDGSIGPAAHPVRVTANDPMTGAFLPPVVNTTAQALDLDLEDVGNESQQARMIPTQLPLTPAQRGLSDEAINQWLVQDPTMAAQMTHAGANGEHMNWSGWDEVVRDFQMDVQQVQQGNGPPAIGDISDWF